MTGVQQHRRARGSATAFRLLTTALLLIGANFPVADAGMRQIEEAFELTPSQITFPGGTAGLVVVQPCPNCARVYFRTTPLTRWQIDTSRQSVRPRLFSTRLRIAASDAAASSLIFVYYDPDKKTINRIRLESLPVRIRQ